MRWGLSLGGRGEDMLNNHCYIMSRVLDGGTPALDNLWTWAVITGFTASHSQEQEGGVIPSQCILYGIRMILFFWGVGE